MSAENAGSMMPLGEGGLPGGGEQHISDEQAVLDAARRVIDGVPDVPSTQDLAAGPPLPARSFTPEEAVVEATDLAMLEGAERVSAEDNAVLSEAELAVRRAGLEIALEKVLPTIQRTGKDILDKYRGDQQRAQMKRRMAAPGAGRTFNASRLREMMDRRQRQLAEEHQGSNVQENQNNEGSEQ